MYDPMLVQIKTADGLMLPGLLHEAKNSHRVAIHLHGNGSTSVFYHDDRRDEMAKILNRHGISLLLFNNRGAHYIKRLFVTKNGKSQGKLFGMSYEKIKDCIKDVDGAVELLATKGYKEFYLIGESTGANKICVYHFYKPTNKISKYILLGGGDDTGIYYNQLGKEKFFRILTEAKRRIRDGKGEDIICELLSGEIFSYQAFYDIANPDGDYNVFPFLEALQNIKLSQEPLFRYFKSLNKPTLVVYGQKDKYAWDVPKMIAILAELKPDFEYHVIKNADHSFSRHQQELSELITGFLVN